MKLRDSQVTAAAVVSPESKLLLADVGAGKTAAALEAVTLRALVHRMPGRTLVLGTKRICDMVWGPEIKTWAAGYNYASAAGLSPAERRAILFDTDIDIVGINFENLIWAANEFGSKLTDLFPNLIIDESSKLENPASKSFRAIKPILPLFQWRLPMTGTPRANYLHDIWGSVYLADLGASLGQYKEAFLQKFFMQVRRGGRLAWIPKHNSEQRIYELIKHVVHRMPFEWHDPVEIDYTIKLNPKVKAIMAEIDKRFRNEEAVVIDGVTYARMGARVNAKMLQLSSGHIYTDDGGYECIHHDKYEALEEIVTEAKGEPLMVVYQFEHEVDQLLARFPQAKLLDDDPQTLADWNDRKIDILIVHPRSCGHGLNAQLSQCDLQVWFTPTTDAELYTQTVGRLNRPGNPKTVRIIRLIMQGTKDKASYLVVAARQRGEDATLRSFEDDN
jgi:SNF2 family DNA or RNA helicase